MCFLLQGDHRSPLGSDQDRPRLSELRCPAFGYEQAIWAQTTQTTCSNFCIFCSPRSFSSTQMGDPSPWHPSVQPSVQRHLRRVELRLWEVREVFIACEAVGEVGEGCVEHRPGDISDPIEPFNSAAEHRDQLI